MAKSLIPILIAGQLGAATTLLQRDELEPKYPDDSLLEACPGYKASNVKTTSSGLTADLKLAGPACNVYGDDLGSLALEVTYETDSRLHVMIQDQNLQVYQVPEEVFPRPAAEPVSISESKLSFNYTEEPFSFSIQRTDTGEVLFDTSDTPIVFESQYLRLRTRLPPDPFLYGLGEHSDPFRLNTTNYTRTLWNNDAYTIPENTNLYSSHPIYLEHRTTGTHAVFLLNSNGMDVIIDKTAGGDQYLEYNTLGGVFDFYFLAGPSPGEVAQQYSEIVGLPQMIPYWGFGFHQCRWGYQDAFAVAEVVYNYSQAGIPLEVMWTDIDYMDRRRVFSLDPDRFQLERVQEYVDYLHDHDQKYVVMVDPAVAYADYPPFHRGEEDDVFMLRPNGSIWKGVVWPGVVAFPDWFAPNITNYWNNEFATFFHPQTGVDIDALWIDMNEPSNFPCNFPCDDPYTAAIDYPPAAPPVRDPPRPLPGFSCAFQPPGTKDCFHYSKAASTAVESRAVQRPIRADDTSLSGRGEPGEKKGLPGRDLLFPKYAIHNAQAYKPSWNAGHGGISNKTMNTDLIHRNGIAEYDVHNLYGYMMSSASRVAMINRRPALRPMIITRSTFPAAGHTVGKWLGDNVSSWDKYRASIRTMLAFTAIYQIPIVGSDVCGFAGNTTESLCARWASLGAFSPFYRNHNDFSGISQEFYRWDSVAESARKAIDIRYRLLDYIYTALRKSTNDATPIASPMFFHYPEDENTFSLELQYFYGPSLLVAPVMEENATSVDVYFPDDIFYDWHTHDVLDMKGEYRTISDQGLADIPLYIRGGSVLPLRTAGGMTTTDVRKEDFELLVAPDREGKAGGQLYLDDGVSLEQAGVTNLIFEYDDGKLIVTGECGYETEVKIVKVTLLGKGSDVQTAVEKALDGDCGFTVDMTPL